MLLEREVVINAFMSVVGVTVVLLRDLQIVSAVKASLARVNSATSLATPALCVLVYE